MSQELEFQVKIFLKIFSKNKTQNWVLKVN